MNQPEPQILRKNHKEVSLDLNSDLSSKCILGNYDDMGKSAEC